MLEFFAGNVGFNVIKGVFELVCGFGFDSGDWGFFVGAVRRWQDEKVTGMVALILRFALDGGFAVCLEVILGLPGCFFENDKFLN